MTEAYQKSYNEMKEAYESFITNYFADSGICAPFICFIRNEVATKAADLIRSYRSRVPKMIEEEKVAEDTCIGIMGRCTRLFTAGLPDSVYDSLLENDNTESFLFEAKAEAEQTLRLAKMTKKHFFSGMRSLNTALFGTNEPEMWDNMISWLQATAAYFGAVDDFKETDSDDLPDSLYLRLDELCALKQNLIFLNSLSTADVIRKARPVNVKGMEDKLQPLYDCILHDDKGKPSVNTLKLQFMKKPTQEFMNALDEMVEILGNKDNYTGFHINHMTDGTIQYVVSAICDCVNEDGTPEVQDGVPACGTKFVGPFNTRKEAEEAEKKLDNVISSRILEEPGEEFYSVLRDSDSSIVTKVLFPYELRALAVLYIFAKPDAFVAYEKSIPETEGSQDGEGNPEKCRILADEEEVQHD